jgi:1-phosphatidylinositol-4-phosphate 5-kinase
MVFQAGEGAGRSGSFFFFSHDRRFIIKTMTKSELTLFLTILPAYMAHLKTNPHSILAKIFGVFTIKLGWLNELHVMLMENTIFLENPNNLQHIFDLKGSTVNREVKGKIKPSTTLKDSNLLLIKR